MSKKTVKIVAIVIAFIFIAVFVLVPVLGILDAAAATPSVSSQIEEVQRQKTYNLNRINQATKQQNAAIEVKKTIETDIGYVETDINKITQKINENNNKITELTGEISALEKKITEKMDRFKARAKVMYEKGTVTYLEALLGSKSFSEFLSRMDVVAQILNYDKTIMDEIRVSKAKIEESKGEIEKAKTENVAMNNRLKSQKSTLVQKKNQQQQVVDEITKDKEAYTKAYEEAERKEQALKKQLAAITASAEKKSGVVYNGVFAWPVPSSGSITSPFGWRIHPIMGTNRFHNGIDISAPTGANVVSAADGTVSFVGRDSVYGNYIIVTHGNVSTLYAHLSRVNVSKGQSVTKGKSVGAVGSTGYSTGPHLHFTVTSGGKDINPMTYLK